MERFEFNPGNGLFVPVQGEVCFDMHRNELVHISASESPDGRERYLGANNPAIRTPSQADPKLCIEKQRRLEWTACNMSLGQADKLFRGIR